jgi:hypothetical protein
VLVAYVPRGSEQLLGEHVHPVLALDRLQEHGRGAPIHRAAQRIGLRGDGAKARHQRDERGLLGLLRSGRQRAVGAPVEGAVHDHHLPARTGLADELDRSLAGLRAGVAEEHLATETRAGQALGQAHGGLGVEEVADVHQPPDLLANGLHHPRVTVPQAGHRDAAQEVQVLVAVDVP